MLDPTELRAHVCFQSITIRLLWFFIEQCSRRVLLEVFVNLLSHLRQVLLLNRIVPLSHFL